MHYILLHIYVPITVIFPTAASERLGMMEMKKLN